jgi:methionyl-tRNA formyltransferase
VKRAVVFGYGDVGVRCLATLLSHGFSVPLVITHQDDPKETQWFSSLGQFARERDLPVTYAEQITPEQMLQQVRDCEPDFIFSFYYRRMLPTELLSIARCGAFNMHGSLLPRYRGRAPINWAILKGERQTGATLHYMTGKPDAGAIIAQRTVPILQDDTAVDVFRKVCVSAEIILHESLPAIADGAVRSQPQNLSAGSYFGARRPEDGVIDWRLSSTAVHDLVRAVAPPFPGAHTVIEGRPARILKTLHAIDVISPYGRPTIFARDGRLYAECGDGRVLRLLIVEIDGVESTAELVRRAQHHSIGLTGASA